MSLFANLPDFARMDFFEIIMFFLGCFYLILLVLQSVVGGVMFLPALIYGLRAIRRARRSGDRARYILTQRRWSKIILFSFPLFSWITLYSVLTDHLI